MDDSKYYIDRNISDRVLSIGPEYSNPRGGIAQVAFYYDKYIFENFKYIANSCEGSKFKKLMCAIKSVIQFIYYAITDRKLKLVHIHTAANISFERSAFFVYLAKIFGLTPIMHVHSGAILQYCERKPEFVKKVLSDCKLIIVLADIWKEFFENTMSITNEIVILENIIPVPTVKRGSFNDGKMHLLFLARVVEPKGILDLADAIIENKENFRDKIVLHVGGEGEDLRELQSRIETAAVQDIIKCEGWIVDEQKEFLLNNCDVFILPTHFEAISLSILEAMSYEMPILATAVGGIPTIVENGKNGILFPPHSKKDIALSINYFLDHKELLRKFGLSSHETVVKFFPENVSQHIENIYTRMLAR